VKQVGTVDYSAKCANCGREKREHQFAGGGLLAMPAWICPSSVFREVDRSGLPESAAAVARPDGITTG
jgi:hypothetical protein